MASPAPRPLAVLDLPAAPYRIHPALAALATPLKKLSSLEGNPRRGDVEAVMRSYRVFGQRKPIVARRLARGRGEVIAGNHQLAAAGELGWSDIAVVFVDEEEVRSKAFAIADNRSSDLATNDAEALAAMLVDVSVDEMLLAAASYTQDELDAMLRELEADEAAPALNDRDSVGNKPRKARSRRGDVWLLGPHKLVVGDARSADDMLLLLGDDRVDMVFTDPPYGVDYEGGTDEALTIQNDALDPVDLEGLLRESFTLAAGVCRPGAGWYVTAPGAPPTSEAFHAVLSELGIWRQTCIWVKDRFVLGRSDYHYRHEDILVGAAPGEEPPDLPPLKLNAYEERHEQLLYGWKPGAAHTPPPDRRQDTVWEFDRPAASRMHPTMKPVDLIIRAVENSCPVGGLVLDQFGGSGSTLIACHTTRRFARLLELDAKYADVICERYQEHTGTKPINGLTGETVDFSSGR